MVVILGNARLCPMNGRAESERAESGLVVFSQRGPARCECRASARLSMTFEGYVIVPDGIEILIGHGVGVRCCFSCGCGLGLCPIVPDGWVVFGCCVQPLTYFSLCCRKEK